MLVGRRTRFQRALSSCTSERTVLIRSPAARPSCVMDASIVPTWTDDSRFNGTSSSAEVPSRRVSTTQIAADSVESIREVIGSQGVARRCLWVQFLQQRNGNGCQEVVRYYPPEQASKGASHTGTFRHLVDSGAGISTPSIPSNLSGPRSRASDRLATHFQDAQPYVNSHGLLPERQKRKQGARRALLGCPQLPTVARPLPKSITSHR